MKLHKGSLKKLFFIALTPLLTASFYFTLPLRGASENNPAAPSVLQNSFELKEELPSFLPIGSVYSSNVENSKGTAVLFPQTHRYPGTEPNDPVNNNAQIAQEQIYKIMSYLARNEGIDFMMAEGDLYGPVPEDKIDQLSQKIALRDRLAPSLGKGFLYGLTQLLEREIALAGAPYQLKARDKDLILYGAENEATYNYSADIVRNYVYLNDRRNQLENGTPQYNSIASRMANPSQTSIPSRTNNPYLDINSLDQINSLIKQNEGKMNDVVLNQRNRETAQNFAKALSEENKNAGIIEFGAEHEKGLVQELNKAGISVIVIKADKIQNL